ncbi:MAG: hypothetical protein ACK5MQ_07420 [Pikeienuella sp.]
MKLIKERLTEEHKLNEFEYSEENMAFIKNFQFLTLKPTIYLANVSENEAGNPESNVHFNNFKEFVESRNEQFVVLSTQIEYEISKLDIEEQKEFLKELGLEQSGLNTVAKKAFEILGLKTYFTAGPEETHA